MSHSACCAASCSLHTYRVCTQENFVSDATTVIKVGEVVKPWVSDIKADGAIRLSLREPGSVRKPRPQSTSGPTRRPRLDASQVQAGNWFEGTAVRLIAQWQALITAHSAYLALQRMPASAWAACA